MVDESWGVTPAPAAEAGRGGSALDRIEARSQARRVAAAEREAARRARHDERARLAAVDPHAAGARQPRASGRKDIVRQQRDTSGYALAVDEGRIRTLAGRGASIDGLAAVFGLSVAEIERILG